MILILSFISSFFSLAATKSISEIKTLSFEVLERSSINGEKKEQTYEIILEMPDMMRKTVIAPQMNKGEIYTYKKGEKTVYLPFFNQIQKSQVTQEENRILDFINTVVQKERDDKNFKKEYHEKEEQEIILSSGEKIIILEKNEIDKFILPQKIEIYSGDINVASLNLSKIRVNEKIKEDAFELKK